MKFNKIVIDGNNLYHKSYIIAKSLLKNYSKKVVYKTIEIFLNSLKKLDRDLASNYCDWYFLWDNPNSKNRIRSQMDNQVIDRRDIDPSYKGNRSPQDDFFYSGIDYLRLLLKNRFKTYNDLRIELFEADDVVEGLIDYLDEKKEIYKMIIVSEDLDWARCMDKNRNIYWYAKKLVWDRELFKHKYHFYPENNNIIMWKVFRGDKEDNIPKGLKNIREEQIVRILQEFDSIYSFLANYSSLDYLSDTMKQKVKESQNRLRLNNQLVAFIPIPFEMIGTNIIEGKRDIEKLKKMYEIFELDINVYEKINYIRNKPNDPKNFLIHKPKVKRQ